jgi:tyrosine-protein phosphatase SIW14
MSVVPVERGAGTVIIISHQRDKHSDHHYDTCAICYTRPGMPLVPPLNFAMIASGVYRSGHPNKQNFAFLRKLGLKTIM